MNTKLSTNTIFVTGTDTDAGKTYVSEIILHLLKAKSLKTAGFKPVSAGCESTPDGLRNEDALRLMQASSMDIPYELVNPIAFADPVAPHLAALKQGQHICMDTLDKTLMQLQANAPDFLLVEGAGGWQLPLGKIIKDGKLSSEHYFMPDFVQKHNMPVVLVVGMKLGCLNHALLSMQAIKDSGVKVLGWVANQVDPSMDYYEENLASLTELFGLAPLAQIKHAQTYKSVSFDIDALFL